MTIEAIGDIADVSLTENVAVSNLPQAQMLARVGHPAARITREANIGASEGQALARREGRTR